MAGKFPFAAGRLARIDRLVMARAESPVTYLERARVPANTKLLCRFARRSSAVLVETLVSFHPCRFAESSSRGMAANVDEWEADLSRQLDQANSMRRSTVIAITGWVVLAIAWAALLIPLAIMNVRADAQSALSASAPVWIGARRNFASVDRDSSRPNATRHCSTAQRSASMTPAQLTICLETNFSSAEMES